MTGNDSNIQHEIEELLRQKIGLNPESVGSRSIVRAVNKGIRTGKMQGLSDYFNSLKTNPDLFESLVESIVVPETSFFRNRASFVFFRQWIAQDWLKKSPVSKPLAKKLRVLSIPCSTGEEPYSLAIALLEEGLSLDDFHIDAVDISVQAIEKAKKAVYSPYAFRRRTYRSDDKYFDMGIPEGATGKRNTQRYFLTESVREKISFLQGNILDPTLLQNRPAYDVVFCRNLLIYFDREARDRTTDVLHRILKPNGLLFVGYAEAGLVDSALYKAVPYPQTFAYRKRTPEEVEKLSVAALDRDAVSLFNGTPAKTERLTAPLLPDPRVDQYATEPNTAKTQGIELLEARALADRQEIALAIEKCDRYVLFAPTDPQGHLLRGELHQAVEDYGAAEASFEKSLYLDPQLEEALTHLLLIKEEKGAAAEAAVVRARLQRLDSY